MNTLVATLTGPHSARPSGRSRAGESDRSTVPVLIRVPSLYYSRSRQSSHSNAPRVRRRLKKEVRVAAATLIFAMPLSWSLFALVGVGSTESSKPIANVAPRPVSEVRSERIAIVEPSEEPRATIGLRTPDAMPSQPAETEVPVVLPADYLVPDEAPEETAHAGH